MGIRKPKRRRPQRHIRRQLKAQKKYPMHKLPTELLWNILGYVEEQNPDRDNRYTNPLNNIRQVCRRLEAVTEEIPYRTFVVTDALLSGNKDPNPVFRKTFEEMVKHTRHLVFEDALCFRNDGKLRDLIEEMPHVETVAYRCHYPKRFRELTPLLFKALDMPARPPPIKLKKVYVEVWEHLEEKRSDKTGMVKPYGKPVMRGTACFDVRTGRVELDMCPHVRPTVASRGGGLLGRPRRPKRVFRRELEVGKHYFTDIERKMVKNTFHKMGWHGTEEEVLRGRRRRWRSW